MTDKDELGFHLKLICSYCGKHSDRIAHPKDRDAFPSAGDANVCLKCLKVSEFDKDLKLIPFNQDRLVNDLELAKEIHTLQIIIQQSKVEYERYKKQKKH